MRQGFQLWHLGDPKSTYPPLRHVETVDVGDDSGGPKQVNKRRRFADFRALMEKIDKVPLKKRSVTHLSQRQALPADSPPLTIHNINSVFDKVAKDVLSVPGTTPKGRKRRLDAILWNTVHRGKWVKDGPLAIDEETGAE